MDVLSDVLQTLRLEGALFLNGEFREPWCVAAPESERMSHVLAPQRTPQPLAICHLVTEGRCWARLADGPALALAAGDVLVLPHGDAHLVGSGLQHAPVSLDDVVPLRMPELGRVRYGGQGDAAVLVCGWFAYGHGLRNPLFEALPRMFRTSLDRRSCGPWLRHSVQYALEQAGSQRPGSEIMATKVAEALFVESLRAYVEDLPEAQAGWLGGLRDPVVARVLALLHADPRRDWTVASLAAEAHVSRTVLAERFRRQVGQPPMQYLKQWRLACAARRLADGRGSLLQVSADVGYASETAFNRAFKAEYGVAPGLWRRQFIRASSGPGDPPA